MSGVFAVPNQPAGLPEGWQLFLDSEGRPFYWNNFTRESSWVPPTQSSSSFVDHRDEILPSGWEKKVGAEGRVYYVDHNTQTTSWEHPNRRNSTFSAPSYPTTGLSDSYARSHSSSTPSIPISQSSITGSSIGSYPPSSLSYPSSYQTSSSSSIQSAPLLAPSLSSVESFGTSALSMSKPTWDVAKENIGCANCNQVFTFIRRRHHCRCCFREFCDTCTTKRSNVPQFNHNTLQRVCDHCYSHLQRKENECLGKLIPYLSLDQKEMSQATKEIFDLLMRHDIGDNSTSKTSIKEDMIDTCGIPPIMDLLSQEKAPKLKSETTTQLLKILSKSAENNLVCDIISKNGGITSLTNLLQTSNTVETRIEIAKIFGHLGQVADNPQQTFTNSPTNTTNNAANVTNQATAEPTTNPKDEIRNSGGLRLLVESLAVSDNDSLLEATSKAIRILILNNEANKRIISDNGLVTMLILLSSQNLKVLEEITSIISELCKTDAYLHNIDDVGGVSALVSLLSNQHSPIHNSTEVLLDVLSSLSTLSGKEAPAKSIAFATNSIQCLLSILQSSLQLGSILEQNNVQQRVVDLILNIFANLSKYSELSSSVNQILLNQGLKTLIQYTTTNGIQSNTQTQILNILFHLISDRTSKDLFRKANGISTLMSITSSGTSNLLLSLAILTKLVDGNAENAISLVDVGGLLVLNDFVVSNESQPDVILQSIYCLNCVVSASEEVVELLPSISSDMVPQLLRLLNSPISDVIPAIIQLLGTMAASNTYRNLIANSSKAQLSTWLDSKNDIVKKSTLRLIGNICSSSSLDDPIREIPSELNLFPLILNLLSSPSPDIQLQATFALKHACRSYNNRESIVRMGGIPSLVGLLRSSNPKIIDGKVRISEILAAFSAEDRFRNTIREAGGIGIFIELLFSEVDLLQKNAIIAMANFAKDESTSEEIIAQGGGLAFISLLSSRDDNTLESCVLAIGHIARVPSSRSSLVSLGAVEPLLAILQKIGASKESTLKASCIWTLTILSSDPGLASSIQGTRSQGLSVLIDLLSTPNATLQHEITFILMNLCDGNSSNWEHIVGLGGIQALLTFLASPILEAQMGASRELLNLIKSQPSSVIQLRDCGAIQLLGDLLHNCPDTEIRGNVVGIIALLSSEATLQDSISKMMKQISPFLSSPRLEVQSSAVRILENLSVGQSSNLQPLLESESLSSLVEFLFSGKDQLIIPASKIICHLSIIENAAEKINSNGGFLGLITLLSHPSEEVREVASLTIGNLVRSSENCRNSIAKEGGMEPFIPLLSSQNPKIVRNTIFIVGALSMNEQFCTKMESEGALPRLIKFLEKSSNGLQPVEEKKLIPTSLLDDGNVPEVTKESIAAHLPSKNENVDIRSTVLRTFANMTCSGGFICFALVRCGIIPILLEMINNDPVDSGIVLPTSDQESASAIIANISTNDQCKATLSEPTFLSMATKSLLKEEYLRGSFIRIIRNLSLNEQNRKIFAENGIHQQIVKLLTQQSKSDLIVDLLWLIQILIFNDEIKQRLIDLGIVPLLSKGIESQSVDIQIASSSTLLSFVCISPKVVSFALADSGGIVPLLGVLTNSEDVHLLLQSLQVLGALVAFEELRSIIRKFLMDDTMKKVVQSSDKTISSYAKRLQSMLGL
eukprot:TRINITY_DN3042_c0_g2_i1.p1 TRINITY_DN3042_c0_g2~~TRINITY_DN3042_c0_g2_i1.p1  ORF type:complete len:1652 (+),score=347.52 TRINITY_DN3042_c0_g2_i1:199-5154(+)